MKTLLIVLAVSIFAVACTSTTANRSYHNSSNEVRNNDKNVNVDYNVNSNANVNTNVNANTRKR